MNARSSSTLIAFAICVISTMVGCGGDGKTDELNQSLTAALKQAGFTGNVQNTLEQRLGRPINKDLAELGRSLFFDRFLALHDDNSCAGCHSPLAGFGDTQSIAIGVDNNDIVGARRVGPRNQRRTPGVINNAFYPKLMVNGRFFANSHDPFDGSQGFSFPAPEGDTEFPPNRPDVKHLLVAQGHIPPTELPEMAGFTGYKEDPCFASSRFQSQVNQPTSLSAPVGGAKRLQPKVLSVGTQLLSRGGRLSSARDRFSAMGVLDDKTPDFTQFDNGKGAAIPHIQDPLQDCTRNYPIRKVLLERFNKSNEYKKLFGKSFPEVAAGKPITFPMIAQALTEFQADLTFARAPVDRFATGESGAMSVEQKRGALVFFGKGRCVTCHAVSGRSNEMFSDFEGHVVAVPQIAPRFGKDTGNVPFRNADGQLTTDGDQDFGLEDRTADPKDRYKFRTSPLRNIAHHPAFFHNGAFTKLEDAIRHHLNVRESLANYDPAKAGVAQDLRMLKGPDKPMLDVLDSQLQTPIQLTAEEFNNLVTFVRDGLLDPGAKPDNLRSKIPASLPSGKALAKFESLPDNEATTDGARMPFNRSLVTL